MRLLAGVTVAPDVGDMEEGGALEADVDERRLHSRQHAHHLAQINIADDAAAGGALDVQFLNHALLHEHGAGLLRGEIDQKVFGHRQRAKSFRK